MTKFKVGDPVRVTKHPSNYFDQVGKVAQVLHEDEFAVVGLIIGASVCFKPDELILAEHPEPPAAGDAVNHPAHYGGGDDPYEAIKVIEAWGLGFHLGNAIKYIARAGKKSGQSLLQDLKKARWYIDRLIERLEAKK